MTWAGARSALYQIPRDAGYATWEAPPPRLPQKGPYAVFTPPGRRFDRRRPARWGYYDVTLSLFSWVPNNAGPEEINTIGKDLDDAIEAVTAGLDGSLKLGGEAASVAAPTWEDATLVEYPEESGRLYLLSQAEILVTVIKDDGGFGP